MAKPACISLYLLSVVMNIESARILAFFPIASISHQVVFRPLTQELARRGHEVIVVTTDPAFPKGQTPENLTEIDVHDISYNIWRKYLKSTRADDTLSTSIRGTFKAALQKFQKQLQTDEVRSIIQDKNKTFDLLLLEACFRPTLALSYVFKAPVIQVSSFGSWVYNYESVGAAVHPIIYPSNQSQRSYNLTMVEKIKQIYNYIITQYVFNSIEEGENELLRSVLGPDMPSLSELQRNIDMLFLNVHPIWEDNRPVPTNVIYMGGLPQKPEKELPADLQSYLDSSKNGVIYVSFGTNVLPSMLPPEKIQVMLNVFSQLPYDIIWKWDKDVLPGRTENIRISKWLPQCDLLRHPKIRLFITQGGLQSTDEAILAGVPLLGIPIVFDQFSNTEKYKRHNIGTQVFIETMDEEKLNDAINKIIGDDSYRRNVARLRSLMYDQPQRPLERAVWWTEHVLRHGGGKHLRAPAANMSWIEYLELRLFISIIAIVLTLVLMLYYLINFVIRLVYGQFSLKVKVKET